eukprot:scaffold140497_cov29-Tisochrysis_lutea.AAC.3
MIDGKWRIFFHRPKPFAHVNTMLSRTAYQNVALAKQRSKRGGCLFELGVALRAQEHVCQPRVGWKGRKTSGIARWLIFGCAVGWVAIEAQRTNGGKQMLSRFERLAGWWPQPRQSRNVGRGGDSHRRESEQQWR